MRILKALFTLFLLVTLLTIPKVVNWLLLGLVRFLTVITKTLSYLIELIQVEVTNKK